MAQIREQANNIVNQANNIVNRNIAGILLTILIAIIPILLYAGTEYIDSRIEEKSAIYSTKQEIVSVKIQISENQKSYFQEKVYEIQDKRIDQTITSSDEKKLIRLKTKINSIEKTMLTYGK